RPPPSRPPCWCCIQPPHPHPWRSLHLKSGWRLFCFVSRLSHTSPPQRTHSSTGPESFESFPATVLLLLGVVWGEGGGDGAADHVGHAGAEPFRLGADQGDLALGQHQREALHARLVHVPLGGVCCVGGTGCPYAIIWSNNASAEAWSVSTVG